MTKRTPHIKTVRAHDVDQSTEGYRVLVDRLWPRGVSRETLQLDCWAKELAPSTELRKWFDHDPAKWDKFRDRYSDELAERKDVSQALLDDAGDAAILLIYAARDQEHNHAIVLQSILEQEWS